MFVLTMSGKHAFFGEVIGIRRDLNRFTDRFCFLKRQRISRKLFLTHLYVVVETAL